jgi:hypothetical protein
MQKITLYRFTRPDGGVTTSLVKPDGEYTELFRLVADEGYILTDGVNFTSCIDTDNPGAWSEVPDPNGTDVIEEKAAAYDIITGVSE